MYSNQLLKGVLLFIFFWCCNGNTHAQLQSTYSIGIEHEHYSILESTTAQGHYVMAGTLESSSGTEIHALEIDILGNPIWERTYSISGKDQAFHIQAAPQGYLIVGVTDSGVEEAFAMSIDPLGNYLTSATYSDMQFGSGSRFLHSSSVQNDAVGGFIAAGWLGGTDNTSQKAAWIVRIDPGLNVMWSRTFDTGGNNNDFDMASNVIEAGGNGFFVSGSANATGGDQIALAAVVDHSNTLTWSTAYADNNGNGHLSVAGSAYYDPVLEEVFQLTNLSIIHHFGVNVFDIATGVRNNFESWAIFSQFGYANIQGFRLMESLNSSNLVIAGYMRDHFWQEVDDAGNTTGNTLTGSVPFMMEIPKHPGAIIAGGSNPVIWDQLYEVPNTNLTVTNEIYDLFSAGQQPRIFHPEMAFRQADGSGYALNGYRSVPGGSVNELELIETTGSGQNNCTSDELGFLDTPRLWFDYPVTSQAINQGGSGFNFNQNTVGSQPLPCNTGNTDPCVFQPSIQVDQFDCDRFQFNAQNLGAPAGSDICFAWDFGDGTTGTNAMEIHTFPADGVYTVCLTMWCCDDPDVTLVECVTITVDCCEAPVPGIEWACEDGMVVITATNNGLPADPALYCWTWEDGTSGGNYSIPIGDCDGSYGICLEMYCCNSPNTAQTVCVDFLIDCCEPCIPLTADEIAFTWTPSFSPNCPQGCSIGFDCPALDPAKYCVLWEFGDGTTYDVAGACPIHCYTCSGVYEVCYTVFCCEDPTQSTTVCQLVEVDCCTLPAETDVDFVLTSIDGCTVNVDLLLPDVPCPNDLCWSWDMGDGTVIAGSSGFTHTYTGSGVYTVCLNVHCCNNPFVGYTICKEIQIDCGCQLPSSTFIDQLVVDGCTVDLQATYTDDYTGPLCFEWDMGDGSTASGETITYTYSASGTYTVCLNVFCCDSPNDVVTICTEITVVCGCDSIPNFEWEYFPNSNGIDCQQGFCITSPVDPSIYCATWDFGDGTVENHPIDFCPVHEYLCDGVYDVCVTVYCCEDTSVALTVCNTITVDCPCSVPTGIDWIYSLTPNCEAQFEALLPINQCPDEYCYTWDFGDGTTTTGTLNPFHAFPGNGVYTVCLTVFCCDAAAGGGSTPITICHEVIIDCGCQDVPDFEWEYFPNSNGIDCQQGFCITTPLDPSIYCATWDFGDGTVENHPIDICPVHEYLCDGVYDVCVTVYCCEDTSVALTVCNTITVDCPCSVPTGIDWVYSLTPDCEAQFDVFFPISQCPESYCYTWDFGDGTTTTGTLNPFHAFPGSGTYNVCLTVFCCDATADGLNSSITICHEVIIDCGDPCPKPCELNPVFIVQDLGDCTYLFNNFTVPGMYTTVSSYFWDFGDGGTSTSTNPTHTFPTSGTYIVCLTVTGFSPEGQCEQTFCWEVVADCYCDSDVNQDGTVSIADLLQILSNFGSDCN